VAGSGPSATGALVSSILSQNNALNNVTLSGDATFGGSGPWDVDSVKNVGLWTIRGGSLSTGGQGYNLTNVGSNQVTIATTVDSALANIDVQQGLLDLGSGISGLGNPANSITVRAGATVSFSNP